MKFLLAGLISLMSLIQSAHAGSLSSTVSFNSNYIYRGLSFSGLGSPYASAGSPVLGATIDYAHESGLGYTLFTSNVDTINQTSYAYERDQEIAHFLSYSKMVSPGIFAIASLNYFSFQRNPDDNFMDYYGGVIV